MVWETFDVLWHNKVDSLVTGLYVADLKDLSVVAEDIRSHLERRNVDYIYILVLGREDSTDLSVLALQEFVH